MTTHGSLSNLDVFRRVLGEFVYEGFASFVGGCWRTYVMGDVTQFAVEMLNFSDEFMDGLSLIYRYR